MSGPTVDIITPPPGTAYAGMTGEAFDVLARLFARHGISAWARDWTDAGLGTADATLPLLAWGYHLDPVGWDALLDRWPADARLMNSARLLRWNGRKTYLSELAAAGVPIVPTHFVPLADETALAGAFADFGGSEIVVKPQVSAGSHDTFRLHRGDPPPPHARRDDPALSLRRCRRRRAGRLPDRRAAEPWRRQARGGG